MRILAVDFGEKHIGTAVGDTTTGVALKFRDIDVPSRAKALETLGALIRDEHIERVVFGLPLTFQFEETPLCETIRAFANALADSHAVSIAFMNEILTSDLSKRLGTSGDKDHSGSALILLQDYLNKATEHGSG